MNEDDLLKSALYKAMLADGKSNFDTQMFHEFLGQQHRKITPSLMEWRVYGGSDHLDYP